MRNFLLCLLVLILIIPIVAGCATQPVDEPQFSQDEVIAIVKRDLVGQPLSSYGLKGEIIKVTVYEARYLKNGKWSGTGEVKCDFGNSIEARVLGARENPINWNFYEKSQTVEIISE